MIQLNWLISLSECSSDSDFHLLDYEVLPFRKVLEVEFDISLNIILSFLPFPSALDVSDDEAITIDDLVEFSLLLIDSIFRVFTLFALSSS